MPKSSTRADRRFPAAPWLLLGRPWLRVVALALAAMVALAVLGAVDLRHHMADLRAARFLNTAQNLKVTLEAAMALGLPLEQLPRAQEMLEREHAATPATLSIEVFDPQGRVLYGTDRSFLGDLVEERWLELAQAAGDGGWRSGDGAVGVPLLNGFGVAVGHVAVRYGASGEQALPAFDRATLAVLGGGLAVFALVLAAVFEWAFGDLGRELRGARAVLEGAAADPALPLARLAAQGVERVEAERRRLDAALAEARRIDDGA